MKITINTDVLKREHLSFGDFLVLLIGYYDLSYKEIQEKLIRDGTVQPNVFNKGEIVLSNNTKDLVAKILMESDNKILSCGLDFNTLAAKLQVTPYFFKNIRNTCLWALRIGFLCYFEF